MKKSLDIFAATNPAYVASIIWQFVEGYVKEDDAGCEYPLVYLPLPIVSSSLYAKTLHGTNTKTGLVEWLNRNAWVPTELATSVQDAKRLSLSGLHLALSNGMIGLGPEHKIVVTGKLKNKSKVIADNSQLKTSLQMAERLGRWFGQVGSMQISLHCLGMRV